MEYGVIIQARTNSSRLKGKVLRNLKGKTVLEHEIERLQQAQEINGIIVATTERPEDKEIVAIAQKCNAGYFCGSEEDVLSRYYYAAKKFQVKHIIRITSDCPLIDPFIIDEVVRCYKQKSVDIMTNVPNELEAMTYPRGMDLEIFPYKWLEKAFFDAKDSYDREHVTPYIYDHADVRYYYRYEKDYSKYRLTLDTPEDWKVIEKIYDYFYKEGHNFYFKDILQFMEEHPEVAELNREVQQKLRH
ncbi:MAG: cytidylyltransferase domain-containing protein [Acetivibrio ethanolgignens]